MKFKPIVCAFVALLCVSALAASASAVEVDCDAAYCFSAEEFSSGDELAGICITGLPAAESGTVMLGQRILQPGDVLTAQQVAQMTFHPLRRETDLQAEMTYLPIYGDRVDSVATMSIAVIGKRDQAPVAEDSAMETYQNLPNEALEGKKITPKPALNERREVARRQILLALEDKGEHIACLEARKHLAWYLRGVAYAAYYKEKVSHISKVEEAMEIIEGIKKDLR